MVVPVTGWRVVPRDMSSVSALFFWVAKMLGLTSNKNPTKSKLLMFETFDK